MRQHGDVIGRAREEEALEAEHLNSWPKSVIIYHLGQDRRPVPVGRSPPTPPIRNAKPQIQKPSMPIAVDHEVHGHRVGAFLARHSPVSTKAKPGLHEHDEEAGDQAQRRLTLTFVSLRSCISVAGVTLPSAFVRAPVVERPGRSSSPPVGSEAVGDEAGSAAGAGAGAAAAVASFGWSSPRAGVDGCPKSNTSPSDIARPAPANLSRFMRAASGSRPLAPGDSQRSGLDGVPSLSIYTYKICSDCLSSARSSVVQHARSHRAGCRFAPGAAPSGNEPENFGPRDNGADRPGNLYNDEGPRPIGEFRRPATSAPEESDPCDPPLSPR